MGCQVSMQVVEVYESDAINHAGGGLGDQRDAQAQQGGKQYCARVVNPGARATGYPVGTHAYTSLSWAAHTWSKEQVITQTSS